MRRLMPSHSLSSGRLAIHHVTHPAWPCHPDVGEELRIGVLDSSFNPPTRAHVGMIQSVARPRHDYDALLLLFSTTNADKGSTHQRPDVSDRVALMTAAVDDLLATDFEVPLGGIAIATSPLPYFADKSHDVVDTLSTKLHKRITLTWFVGWDTLVRIFNPKYYQSSSIMTSTLHRFLGLESDASRLMVFRRPSTEETQQDLTQLLNNEDMSAYVTSGQISCADLKSAQLGDISSTTIREAVGQGRWGDVEQLTTPSVVNLIRQHHFYADT